MDRIPFIVIVKLTKDMCCHAIQSREAWELFKHQVSSKSLSGKRSSLCKMHKHQCLLYSRSRILKPACIQLSEAATWKDHMERPHTKRETPLEPQLLQPHLSESFQLKFQTWENGSLQNDPSSTTIWLRPGDPERELHKWVQSTPRSMSRISDSY